MKDIIKYWDEKAGYGRDRSVIDPNDVRGYKNRYIISLRDHEILKALKRVPEQGRILDFGCGSGNLSRTMAAQGYRPAGVDISFDLLRYANQQQGFINPNVFVQYDGMQLPFSSNSFDACVTFWVLNYLVDAESICRALKEIHRVLKPGGILVAVEQTRQKRRFISAEMKLQRPAAEFLQLFEASGFHNREHKVIRRGHFPLIYLIRYGFIPSALFPWIGKMEAFWGKLFKEARLDYADTIIVTGKPA